MSLSALISTCLGERDPLGLARQQASDWEAWLQPISPRSAVCACGRMRVRKKH